MPSLRSILLLGSFALFVSADRGNGNKHNVPTTCNNEPGESGELERRFARGQGGLSSSNHEARSTEAFIPTVSVERALHKRGGTVSFDQNCNAAPPNGPWQRAQDFPTMESAIKAAYADAVTLAQSSKDIAADHKAFTHYFGGEATDVQLTHFKAMMDAVASDTQYYNVQFECSGTGGDCGAVSSAANTDASTGAAKDQKTIHICSRFWTYLATTYLLEVKDAHSPPYRPKTGQNGWCSKRADGTSSRVNQYFATAGHTILHELTHLDSLAEHVGLEAPTDGDDAGRHGTDDPQDGCELAGARDYLKIYKKPNDERPEKFKGMASPDYNAESYAAAATEKYFMDLCEFTEIRPLVTEAIESEPDKKPAAGRALSIAMISAVNSHVNFATVANEWHFYTTNQGKAVQCNDVSDSGDFQEIKPGEGSSDIHLPEDVDDIPWPTGEFKLNIEGEDCTYKCNGQNAGRLFCPQRDIECTEDGKKSNRDSSNQCGSSRVVLHPSVYCDF